MTVGFQSGHTADVDKLKAAEERNVMIKPSEKMRRWKEEGGTGFLFVDSAIRICEDYEAEVEAEIARLHRALGERV